MIKQFLIIVFVLIGLLSKSQSLLTECADSNILVGQPVLISYSVLANGELKIDFNPYENTILANSISESGQLVSNRVNLEILNQFTDTTTQTKEGSTWVGKYTITIWDSGVFVIPGPTIVVNDSSFNFKDIRIKCLLVDPIKGVEIYDIKEHYANIKDRPFSVLDFLKSNWWWILILLIIGLGYFIYRKRNNSKSIEVSTSMTLKERTLFAIDALESSKLWEKDKLKEHFVELSYIIRRYLTSRYEVSLLEMTTEEIKYALTRKGLNKETVEVIITILGSADMVKFAKSKPELIEILKVSKLARQVIAETSPLDFDNAD